MRFSDIPRNPDSRTLRQFAFIWIIFFSAIGSLQLFKGNTWGWPIIGLAVIAGIPGLFWPNLLKPIFVTWMILAFPIGWVVSHLLLAAIFFLVFFPIGFVLRVTGHDPLRLKKPKAESYWTDKLPQADSGRYLKQY